jgi:hypothetical protein
MLSHIANRKRHNRLPEDSGEWHPIPAQYHDLPAPDTRRRKAFASACMSLILQAILCALATWFAIEHLPERDLAWVPLIALAIGLVTSAYVAGYIAHEHRLQVRETIVAIMQGQFWWCALLLIPCYGWFAFALLGVPCAFGAFFGAVIGTRIGNPRGAWS